MDVGLSAMRREFVLVYLLFLGGCTAFTGVQKTLEFERQGPEIVPSAAHQLLNLPPPKTKAVVAVYEF